MLQREFYTRKVMIWYEFMVVHEGGYECLHLYGGDTVLDECHVDLFACLSYKCTYPLANPLPTISLYPSMYLIFISYFQLIYRSLLHLSLPPSSFIICPLNSVFISASPHLPSLSMPHSLPFHRSSSISFPSSLSQFFLPRRFTSPPSNPINGVLPPRPRVHLCLRHPIHIPSSFRCNAY